MWYQLLLTVALVLTYVGLFFLLPRFFLTRQNHQAQPRLYAIIFIALFSFLTTAVSEIMPDKELGNRILHMVGGGVLVAVICFLAVRDSRSPIDRFQFFVFSFLLASTLGVANEIAEAILQNITGLPFANSINDTWFDLISNTVGALVAGTVLTRFIHEKHSYKIS